MYNAIGEDVARIGHEHEIGPLLLGARHLADVADEYASSKQAVNNRANVTIATDGLAKPATDGEGVRMWRHLALEGAQPCHDKGGAAGVLLLEEDQ